MRKFTEAHNHTLLLAVLEFDDDACDAE